MVFCQRTLAVVSLGALEGIVWEKVEKDRFWRKQFIRVCECVLRVRLSWKLRWRSKAMYADCAAMGVLDLPSL